MITKRHETRAVAAWTCAAALLVAAGGAAQAGRKAPSGEARRALTPAQVWKIASAAYLSKDFKTLYAQFSTEDKKKLPYKQFLRKIRRDYDDKVVGFRKLKFVAGKTTTGKDGRQYHRFSFELAGKKHRGGKMVREPDGWRLYHFH